VLLGRAHWSGITGAVAGDAGARRWLDGRDDVQFVECGDLAAGRDVDHPAAP
jgi:hypothetical protein